MMRKLGQCAAVVGLALLALSLPVTASAQVQRGSLLVHVADESGGVLPGATLELTSPVMPGAINAVSDSTGQYRFPSLVTGTYQLKVSLSGMQTLIRQNLVVTQGQTIEVSVALKVGAMSEAVTVQAETPVIDTKAATLATNIDKHILQGTPGGQDIWSIIEYKAPGVTIDTGNGTPPDVGGNQGGLQRSMTARGVPNGQNTQMLNGVNVNDPAAQGFSMNYYVPAALDNIQVSTAAEDISIGTAGVFINMVTKSGSNHYGGSAMQTCQGKCGFNTQSHNINAEQQAFGLRAGSNGTNLISNSNFQIGGPIVRNRLFFFQSTNFQAIHVGVTGFPTPALSNVPTLLGNSSQLDTTDTLAGEGKVNFQLNPKHRFEGYLSKQRYDKPNRAASISNTQDSDWKELDTFLITQASWNYVMSERMFLDTKVSYNNTHFDLLQKTDLQPLSDQATGNLYRNMTSGPLMFRRRSEVVSNWQYFLPNWLGGRHEFRLGFDNGYTPETVTTNRAGNATLVFDSSKAIGAQAQTVQVFNSPTVVNRAVNTTALYGQESYSINRLTAVAGLRWERIEGFLPQQNVPSGNEFFPTGTVINGLTINGVKNQSYTVQSTFAPVHDDPLWFNFAPRTSLTYDLTGHGTSVVKFSAGRYLDQINTGTPPNPNGTVSQTYTWNDLNNDLVFDPTGAVFDGAQYVGGEFGALQRTNIPSTSVFNQAEKRPYTNQQTIEYDREVIPGLSATVAFVHTAQHNQLGTVDQNMASWFDPTNPVYTAVNLIDPGRDGILGGNNAADDKPITVYQLIDKNTVIQSLTQNNDLLDQHAKTLSFNLNKRFSHGWGLIGGYTFAHITQAVTSVSNPNSVLVNANGISGGRAHDIKIAGTFQLPYQVIFGINSRFDSGLPITRTWSIPSCTTSNPTNCLVAGTTVNAEPRGSVELPWLNDVDIRFGRFFNIGTNRFDVSIDVYNITNANTIYSVRTSTGQTTVFFNNDLTQPSQKVPSFLSPTGVNGPRILRLNVTWTFGAR